MAKRTRVSATQVETVEKKPAAHKKQKPSDEPRLKLWIAGIAGGLSLFLLIYLLRLDRIVGLGIDDAWYVLLAKALATGQGYTLINSPSPGITPLYPPAFPWLLSLLYRLSPHFPQNLWLLKSVSIVAMLGTGIVACYYFMRERELPPSIAFGIGLATAICPPLVFMATSMVMSEGLFTLVQLLTIFLIERCVRASKSGSGWHYAVLGAICASVAFLTRSMGIGLIAAAVVYLLKERRLRAAFIFAAAVAATAGPWMIYSRLHAPTPVQIAEQNSYIVQAYTSQFWHRVAGLGGQQTISLSDLPARISDNAVQIVGLDVGGMIVTSLFPGLSQGMGERLGGAGLLISLPLSALALAGFVSAVREKITLAEIALPLSLTIIVAWPFPPFRFVLPFLPFVIFYILMGIRAVYRWHQWARQVSSAQTPWVLPGIAVGVMVALNTFANLDYILKTFADSPQERPRWTRVFEETETLLKWVSENLSQEDAIVTHNPPLVYLYTERKTTTFTDPAGNWENWKRLGVRYLVPISQLRLPDPDADESRYRIIYRQRGNLNLRVVDFGPASSRSPWGVATRLNLARIEPSQ